MEISKNRARAARKAWAARAAGLEFVGEVPDEVLKEDGVLAIEDDRGGQDAVAGGIARGLALAGGGIRAA